MYLIDKLLIFLIFSQTITKSFSYIYWTPVCTILYAEEF